MSDIGKSLRSSLFESQPRRHANKCLNCGNALELYEIDVKKSVKAMKCERCGLIHFYRKDIVGKWRLQRVAKFELTR